MQQRNRDGKQPTCDTREHAGEGKLKKAYPTWVIAHELCPLEVVARGIGHGTEWCLGQEQHAEAGDHGPDHLLAQQADDVRYFDVEDKGVLVRYD